MLLPKNVVDRIYLKLQNQDKLRQRGTPHDQRWLLAIESVYKKLNPEMQRLFTLHFQEHRSGLDVMYELCIERSTFYAWREQILMQIAVAAVESGAMQIFYD